MSRLRVVIVSGLSGAGRTTALRAFEDSGFYCIDNLPTFLLKELLASMAGRAGGVQGLAIGMDVRDDTFPAGFLALLPALRTDHALELLFVEADESALLRRFSEMRRPHPLAGEATVRDGIDKERRRLTELAQAADLRIDTSNLSPHALRSRIRQRYGVQGDDADRMRVTLLSFGFKHGVPVEADLLFDVRFLPNPHHVPDLRPHTGREQEVADFVLGNGEADRFLDLLLDMLSFLIPLYRREGKVALTIGIGCTGGRHRSVAVTEAVGQRLAASGEPFLIVHRELVDGEDCL